jgi:tetratricopeptide (TPR) repeat protein
VRAAAARRAQRLTAGLAVSVLATVCVAGGGWWWIANETSLRQAKTGHAVQETLQAAERLRGLARAAVGSNLGPWKDALAAAHRARALVESSEVEAGLRARVMTFADGLAGEEHAARAQAQQRVRDAEMVARLEEVPIEVEENPWVENRARRELERQDDAYRSTFRGYGIEVESQTRETTVQQIRSSAIATELAAALDWWAMCRRPLSMPNEGKAWRQLMELAKEADPDPMRVRLPQILLEIEPKERAPALEQLLEQAEVRELPPVTVLVLGVALASHGLRTKAADLFRSAVGLHPGDFNLNSRLALQLEKLDAADHRDAVRFHQAALALRPASAVTRHRLAHALRDAGRLEEAIAAHLEVIRLQPDNASAHCCHGDMLCESGNLIDATAAYREAIRMEPSLVWAHNNLGIALKREGNVQEAIASYRAAIRWRPSLAMAHYNLGIALREQGMLDEAAVASREAIRLQPGHADAHNNLGATLRELGKLDEAVVAFREAIRLQPGVAAPHMNLGASLRDQG